MPGLTYIIGSPLFQDDLEREIERLRGKLSRAESKKSSKTDGAEKEKEKEKKAPPPPITTTAPPESDTICEICEQPGHDLFACPILKDDDNSVAKPNASDSKEYCEDCESYGHAGKRRPSVPFDTTNTCDSCQLSALSRCILASRTTHSLFFPLSRRSRFSARRSLELHLQTLLLIFRIILFENLVGSNSALYCLVFLDTLQILPALAPCRHQRVSLDQHASSRWRRHQGT